MRGGNPSNYDGMSLKELEEEVRRMKAAQSVMAEQIDAVGKRIQAINKIQSGNAGSSSTVSSAGEGRTDITNLYMYEIASRLRINDRLCLKRRPPLSSDYLTQEFTMDQPAIDFINGYKDEQGSKTNILAFMQYLVNVRKMKDYISIIEIIGK